MQSANQPNEKETNVSNFDRLIELLRYEPLSQLTKAKLTNFAVSNGFNSVDIDGLLRELVRLNQTCNLALDLRWKVKGVEVNEVKILDKTHFIDPWTAKFLVEEIKRYNKKYTVGAYEKTRQFFNTNKRSLQSNQKALDTDIQVVKLCNEFSRGEERMHFAKTVTVYPLTITENQKDFSPDESNMLEKCSATTSNISKSGLKIKTFSDLEEAQFIVVRFDSLEKELVFSQSNIVYKVLKGFYEEQTSSYEYILELQDNEVNEEFSHYLQNLIYSHKYKYKVDLESIVESAFSKGCEKHINNLDNVIECFLDKRGKLTYILQHPDNEIQINYFEGNLQKIATSILKSGLPDTRSISTFLFCAKGTVTLSDQKTETKVVMEIFDPKEPDIFFKVVNQFRDTKSAILFKVTSSKVDQNTVFRSSSIPEESQELYGSHRINRHSNVTRENIKKLNYHVSLEPLHIESLLLLTQAEKAVKAQPTLLPMDGAANQSYKIIDKEKDEKRLEDRFNYMTKVAFQHHGETVVGNTLNVSSLGLAVKVNRYVSIAPGSKITLSFPQLADRTTIFDLTRCMYEVVECQDGLLRLNNKNYVNHDARDFWFKFVMAKLDQMKATGRENEDYGLCRALSNIAIHNRRENVVFYKLLNKKPLATAFIENTIDLTPEIKSNIEKLVRYWFYKDEVYDQLKEAAKKVKADKEPQSFLLLVNKHQSLSGTVIDGANLVPIDKESLEAPDVFDLARIQSQQQLVYEVTLYKTGNNFSRYNVDEVNYIKRYYPHKGEELLTSLNDINGMITLTDISNIFRSSRQL
ncbi:PilZ domain-containing protein [Aliiglaciecola sp.]|nr:PilZ domain-containing protein [Aliiglaciecola sp.]